MLHHRAALDRWVNEAVAALRWHAEDVIAGALLAAETGFTAELATRDVAESVAAAERIRVIDDEIRRLTRDGTVDGADRGATTDHDETGW